MYRGLLLLLCCTVFLAVPGFGLVLDPIPEGFQVIMVFNNHSSIPFSEMFEKLPIPELAMDNIGAVIDKIGFHPLKDLTRIQLMLKKTKPGRVKPESFLAVMHGKIHGAKIIEFVKEKGLPVEVKKLGNYDMLQNRKGASLCFISDSMAILARRGSDIEAFIAARDGKNASTDFASIKNKIDKNAYVTLLVGNTDFMMREMEHRREKMKKAGKKNVRAKIGINFIHEYLHKDCEPVLFKAWVKENSSGFSTDYKRDGKEYNFKGSFECNDPKTAVSKIVPEFFDYFLENRPAANPK